MLTRRTVLVGGAAIAAVGAVGAGSLALVRRPVPLTLATLRPLVGRRFRDSATGRTLTLAEIGGPHGTPSDRRFSLRFTAASTADLPGRIRTLHLDDRALTVYLEPVDRGGTVLEAVVDRSV